MTENPYAARADRIVELFGLDTSTSTRSKEMSIDDVLGKFEKRGAIHVRKVLGGWFDALEESGLCGHYETFGWERSAYSAEEALAEWDITNNVMLPFGDVTATPLHLNQNSFAQCFVPLAGLEGRYYVAHCGDGPDCGTVWNYQYDLTNTAVWDSPTEMLDELEACLAGRAVFHLWTYDLSKQVPDDLESPRDDAWDISPDDSELSRLRPGPRSWDECRRTSELVGEIRAVVDEVEGRQRPDLDHTDPGQIDCALDYISRTGAPDAKWLLREYFGAMAWNSLINSETLFAGMPAPNVARVKQNLARGVRRNSPRIPLSLDGDRKIAIDCSHDAGSGTIWFFNSTHDEGTLVWDSLNAMLENLRDAVAGNASFLCRRLAIRGDLSSWEDAP